MKMQMRFLGFMALVQIMMLASCHKSDKIDPPSVTTQTGLYMLCQGQGINPGGDGALLLYNPVTKNLIPDQYSAVNGSKIGELPTDLEISGTKMYITVSVGNVLDIVDSKTSKLIKEVNMPGRFPSHIAFYKGLALITCLDGSLAVMDTTTFAITKNISFPSASQPAGLVVVKDKAYVTEPGIEGTSDIVSVIDLTTLKEIKQIFVIPEPISAVADAEGNVYVMSQAYAEFFNCPPSVPNNSPACEVTGGITIIDSKTDEVTSFRPALGSIWTTLAASGDSVYYDVVKADSNKMSIVNANTQSVVNSNFLPDYPSLSMRDIAISPVSGEMFILAGNSFTLEHNKSQLYAFSKNGKLEYMVPVGDNVMKIAMAKN